MGGLDKKACWGAHPSSRSCSTHTFNRFDKNGVWFWWLL